MRKINIKQTENIIDWTKPMWVVSQDGCIVLTTGKHDSNSFSGMMLPCTSNPKGIYASEWSKQVFKPLEGAHEVIISNED